VEQKLSNVDVHKLMELKKPELSLFVSIVTTP